MEEPGASPRRRRRIGLDLQPEKRSSAVCGEHRLEVPRDVAQTEHAGVEGELAIEIGDAKRHRSDVDTRIERAHRGQG